MRPRGQRTHTRRSFLGAAGACVAPLIVPRGALARQAAPSDRIGIGFIGLGGRGRSHLNALVHNPQVRVVGLCDPFRNKCNAAHQIVQRAYAAETKASKFQGCGCYTDFRQLLARPDLDAVVIASPEYWHALHALWAVRAGKDVYCEKAMTLTHYEGRRLVAAVRRHGRVFQLGTQQRSAGNFRFACELARNGYLGPLERVQVGVPGGRALPNAPPSDPPPDLDYEMWLGPAPYSPYNRLKCSFNWYFIYDYCIGWIGSWGVHHIDIAAWGAPALTTGKIAVEGTAVFPTDGLANTSIAWDVAMRTPDGLVVSFTNNRKNPQGCRFIGKEGWVHVNRGGIRADPPSLLRTRLKASDERLYVSTNHHGNFLECIRTCRDPVAPVEAGHIATTLTIISDIATRLGRRLVWDWGTERFDDEVANRFLRRPMRGPWTL